MNINGIFFYYFSAMLNENPFIIIGIKSLSLVLFMRFGWGCCAFDYHIWNPLSASEYIKSICHNYAAAYIEAANGRFS